MPTTVELVERLEELRKQRASGALTVRYADGRSVTYRSDVELAAAIADVERQIYIASGVPITTILVGSSKGLE